MSGDEALVNIEEQKPVLEQSELMDSSEDLHGKLDNKLKHTAKRRVKRNSSSDESGPVNGVAHPSAGVIKTMVHKNDRKSRDARGRGLAKKGGAGGKHTWGRPGEVYDEEPTEDVNDPNYDSDIHDKNIVVKSIALPMTAEDIQKAIEPIILEYFEHGDTDEVAATFSDLNIGDRKHDIPLHAVTIALEKKTAQKEMTSVLLSYLKGKIYNEEDLAKAFMMLLDNLDDLKLDSPDAPEVLGQFIARCVADDCLPPKFVHSNPGPLNSDLAKAALERAHVLLNMKHGLVRLDNVWGCGGGRRPNKHLIKMMLLLLKEYLSSEDKAEAARCLHDLEVPHFHHELVYEALNIVIDDDGKVRTMKLIVGLLKSFCDSTIITADQMFRGFDRFVNALPEISVDVPHADTILDKLADLSVDSGFLTAKYRDNLSTRGRKRFVSEGDGGLQK